MDREGAGGLLARELFSFDDWSAYSRVLRVLNALFISQLCVFFGVEGGNLLKIKKKKSFTKNAI